MKQHSSNGISLIICSRNRADQLCRCLLSISIEELNNVCGEVILVDSDSSDDTYKIMCQFKARCTSDVQILRTNRPGLGFARNVGVAHAKRDILAFTDDDCYLAPDYLEKAATVLINAHFQYCGGRILLYDESDAMIAVNYQNRFELIHNHSFIPTGKIQGANMVVHKKVFSKIGGFNPSMGAGTRFRCEDIEFIGRASMNGFTGAHVPELVVYHHHGKKNGSAELEKLRKNNDIARGAYYAAMITYGYRNYIYNWIINTFLHNPSKPWTLRYFKIVYWELLGATRFWRNMEKDVE